MIAYSYNDEGYYSGEVNCQANPRKSGQHLLPANSTLDAPPSAADKEAKWNGSSWDLVDAREFLEDKAEKLAEKNEWGTNTYHEVDGEAVARDQADIDADDQVKALAILKRQRDAKIKEVEWMRSRHKDEEDLSMSTTLDASEFTELLQYIQDLRDMPENTADNTSPEWPDKPAWM